MNDYAQTFLLDKAIGIALQAHAGKLDKNGQPYVLHVLRVGAQGKTLYENLVGFLHDVLEDTNYSASVLHTTFGPKVMVPLAAITREPGEVYAAYIERVAKNPVARAVKIYDLNDNIARLHLLTNRDEAESLHRRYRAALVALGVDEI